jgi:hypothetical protein
VSSVRKKHRGKILYALCRADDTPLNHNVRGLESSPIYAIDQSGIRAIVSDTLSVRLRPDRSNISAHQTVLKSLTTDTTVLPMRFGVLARDAGAVEKLLATNVVSINEHFERLNGRVEMGLRVSWDVTNIYEHFVNLHPTLAAGRDQIWSQHSGSSARREEKIQLGNMYEALRTSDRQDAAEKVKDILFDYCEDIVENPLKREKDVINFACLIERSKLDEFVSGVFEASKAFDNSYIFDYTGPWAPHNFIDLDLHAPTKNKKVSTSDNVASELDADDGLEAGTN